VSDAQCKQCTCTPLQDLLKGEAFDIRDAIKQSLSSMPFPVSAAALEVITISQQTSAAFAGADNLAALRRRAVAGLSLLHMFADLLRDTPPAPHAAAAAAAATGSQPDEKPGPCYGMGLHSAVSTFRDLLQVMGSLAKPYCNRGAILHMLSADAQAERAAFERICDDLTRWADNVLAAAKASQGYAAVTPAMLTRLDEPLLALRLGANYTDHLAKLQGAVKECGGLDGVCKAPEV
jgi:hypothetical protein